MEHIRQSGPEAVPQEGQRRAACPRGARPAHRSGLYRAGGNILHGFKDVCTENGSSQGRNLALAGLFVWSLLDGKDTGEQLARVARALRIEAVYSRAAPNPPLNQKTPGFGGGLVQNGCCNTPHRSSHLSALKRFFSPPAILLFVAAVADFRGGAAARTDEQYAE